MLPYKKIPLSTNAFLGVHSKTQFWQIWKVQLTSLLLSKHKFYVLVLTCLVHGNVSVCPWLPKPPQ